jgi:hypothetical protein
VCQRTDQSANGTYGENPVEQNPILTTHHCLELRVARLVREARLFRFFPAIWLTQTRKPITKLTEDGCPVTYSINLG